MGGFFARWFGGGRRGRETSDRPPQRSSARPPARREASVFGETDAGSRADGVHAAANLEAASSGAAAAAAAGGALVVA
jgi:hypothetical protein